MITGSIVALATPLNLDGTVNWQDLEKLVDFHLKNGTDAIVSVGTTGESATLNTDEHIKVIAETVKLVNGQIPVIAGTGANSTSEAIHLTQKAKFVGVDASLLVTPYYNKPTQEGLFLHHKAIAEAVELPQILYNVPGRTACDMLPATVARIAELTNIIGIKEATGDLQRGQEVLDLVADKIAVYSGDDETAYQLMLMGAKGNISVTANVLPQQMHDLCVLAMAGEADKAKALNDSLMPVHNAMFVEANPIPVKWALHLMGLMPEGIRLPLTPLSSEYRPQLEAALKQAGAP